MNFLDILFIVFLISLLVQGIFNLFLTMYAWETPDRLEQIKSPSKFSPPKISFTVLLPARHEESVIGETVRSIAQANYPRHLIEIMVICEVSDAGTIAAAQSSIVRHQLINTRVVTFDDKPVNKPHGLNKGLELAKHNSVVIFDAEDQVHPDIFNIANTIYQSTNADVIQAGVQLMNYHSSWYAAHNVLEYFFYFKSRMHFQTKVGVVALGGNTVFMKTIQMRQIGGWDENCLTEDADVGIRLSSMGAKIVSTYDAIHVTKEETPDTLGSFIKQRTRWNQGFIQILRSGVWRNYDSFWKKLFCVYCMVFPLIQAFLLAITPIVILLGFFEKLPVVISLLSFAPLMVASLQLVVNIIGLVEFTKEQNLKLTFWAIPSLIITYIPYQLLLGVGALRASYRELRGFNNWEKTEHSGLHRVAQSRDTQFQAEVAQ